ncbi:MAG: tRNA pseudouridine(38-40) synthase TruA [Methanobrevibacter sp.]|nr:tRNA pseudouridine(38-40) synthase TruA [Methanobrevibacter sp.]
MKRVALKIAYIGTNFHGLQRQPNHRTVEGEIIDVLKELEYIDDLDKAKIRIAGRTDRGVHSLGNVISFMSEKEVIINQINHKLPEDIQIIAKAPVRYGFKARYAQCKHYRYIFFEDNLNISAMNELAKIFIGEHDFTNFSKRNQKTPIRKIDNIEIIVPETKDSSFYEVYSQKALDNYSLKSEECYSLKSEDNYSLKSEECYSLKSEDNYSLKSEDNYSLKSEDNYSQKSEDNHFQKVEGNTYLTNSSKYDADLKESGDFLKSNYIGELRTIGRFNKNFNNVDFNNTSYSPIYIDVYGESFLWNMIRKMMRIFLWVGKNELDIESVKDMLNHKKKYNIKALNPESLILMDISYNDIKFQYDDYALEGFKRMLIENLFDYKLKLSIENSILNSMESLKNKDFYRK